MRILSSDPEVKDTRQAYNLFYETYDRERDKEKRNIVLKKWNDLVLPKIEEAIEKKDVQEFFGIVLSQFFPPSGEAMDLALSWSETFVLNVSSLSQVSEICRSFTRYDKEHGNVFVSAIDKKWEIIAISEIEKTNDFNSLKLILNEIPSTVYELFFTKWCSCSSSVNHIKEVNYAASERISSCSGIHQAIDKATDEILFDQIPKIKNINSIKEYYRIAPKKSATKLLAFEKWLELCKTPGEANEAYQVAPEGKQEKAYQRVKELNLLK